MASTYTTGFGIEKIGTGEQAGAWGTTTNHNADILDRIASYKAVALSGTTHTLTVREASPGSGTENLQDGMYRVIKFTGALGANNTVTIAPNTSPAYFIIENATTDSGSSGPYSVILTQGSGANVTVQNGKNAIIYCDGAGSGAVVYDALADLQVGTLEVTGAAAIDGALTAAAVSATTLTASGIASIDDATQSTSTTTGSIHTDGGLGVVKDVFIGGNIDIDGTTNLDAVDIDGAVQLDSTLTVGVDDQGYDVKFFGDAASAYMLWDTSTDDLILGGASNMGIGVVAPLEKLHVQGDMGVGANGADSYIYFARDGGTNLGKIGRIAAGDLAIDAQGSTDIIFKDGGAENMRITDAGLVGIGTAAPATALHVAGVIKSGVAGTNGHLELARTSDGATITNFITDGTNGVINSVAATIIQVNTTEKVRVTSTGVAITGGITGDVVAVQSEMETATAVDAIVSPGRQHFHPSAAKFWCQASISGTAITSYNVTSVTDTAVGKVTVNIATDFSSADFCAVGGAVLNLGATAALFGAVSPPTAAGTILVQATNIANNAFVDPAEWSVVGFGDLA